MKPEDAARLLGGYATGTLTDAERRALFEAALASQELFNALGDEQALKELLDDPAVRRRLLDALEEAKEPLLSRIATWFTRPSAWALAGGAAALLAVIAVRSLVEMPRKQAIALKTAQPVASVPQPIEKPAVPKALKNERKIPAASVTVGRKDVVLHRKKEAEAPAAAEFAAPPPPPPVEERADLAPRQEQLAPMAAQAPPAELKSAVTAEVAASARRPGLRYSVLREEPDGRFAEVDPRTHFQAGDRVRVAFEPDEDGHLYVLLGDAADRSQLLFRGRVNQKTRYSVPAEPIVLEGAPGERRLLAVFSISPAPELEGPPSSVAAVRLRDAAALSKRAATTELDFAARPAAKSRVVVEIPLAWR